MDLPNALKLMCAITLIAFAASSASAQNASFDVDRITTREGLSHSEVMSILQDSRGFMWFGTRDGLDRYDGYGICSFRPDPLDSTSLSDYVVTAIAEDSTGNIWAGTLSGGLSRLDRRTGRFTRFRHRARDIRSLDDDAITVLTVDPTGALWIGTRSGLNRLNSKTADFTRYDAVHARLPMKPRVTAISCGPRGELWVSSVWATRDGGRTVLSRFNRQRDTFEAHHLEASNGALRIAGVHSDGELDLVYAAFTLPLTRWLARFDPRTNQLRKFVADSDANVPTSVMLIAGTNGDWWTAVPSNTLDHAGFQHSYSLVHGPIISMSAIRATRRASERPERPSQLLTGRLRSSYKDRQGNIWIGIADGVTRISHKPASFTTWRHDPDDSTSLSSSMIRSIQVDAGGSLWVGTDHGLNRLDRTTGRWRHYYSDWRRPGLGNNSVNVMYLDRDSTLLIGTNDGLSVYRRHYDRFVTSTLDLESPQTRNQRVWSILRDRRGQLWVGTSHSGLAQFDDRGRRVRWHALNAEEGVGANGVWCLHEDAFGTLWVGTNDGLFSKRVGDTAFRRYTHDPNDRRSIGGQRVWDISEDRTGTLWISTFGGGLSRYDRVHDSFTTITGRDGLSSNQVFGSIEASNAELWISTANGLVRWDRQSNRFRTYGEPDGLQGSDFAFKAHFKAKDGTMYFGGSNGLSAIDPSTLTNNKRPPAMSISDFKIFDSVASRELFDGDTVRLRYDQSFFSMTFAALDFTNSRKNRYAYKLEGFDPTWTTAGSSNRVAKYTEISPGTYTLRVRGSNNDAVWNNEGISVIVIISPPWWGTLWFRGATALLVMTGGIASYKTRIGAVRRRETEKREAAITLALESQESERLRIARDLHDGVGQLLAAAGLNLARLRELMPRNGAATPAVNAMHAPLHRTIAIVDHVMIDVRAISHGLGTSTLTELGLEAAIGELLGNIATEGSTRFEFVTAGMEERPCQAMEIGLFRIVQETIANILRHAQATEATVQIVRGRGEIRLIVEDNGVGFDCSERRHGMGFQNVLARVTAMGGEMHCDSARGHGATITVTVPTHGFP